MRVFVAGATGAIGKRLVPRLVRAGHHVVGTTRSPDKVPALRESGAEAVVLDVLDRDATIRAVSAAKPDVIVHQLTAIPPKIDFRRLDATFAATNELRTRGTDHLIDAALQHGVRKFVAQSFAGWPFAATGGPIKSEEDPLEDHIPPAMQQTLAALRHLETRVTGTSGIDGTVLRYAMLYGPASVVGPAIDTMLAQLRKRQLPIVGSGDGVWSFLHIDDAAEATRLAIEKGDSGIYNIADDEPARAADLFTALAAMAGARPPRRIPVWLARMIIGSAGVRFMTEMRGASNRKAKQRLGWTPRWTTWREGFRSGLAEEGA